jgi:phosphate:Na+ symporter
MLPEISEFVTTLTQPTRPFIARHLANAHTIFCVMSALLFLPFIGFFARSADRFLPGGKEGIDSEPRPKYLDHRVINTPPIALLQVKNELRRMAEIARSMFNDTVEQFYRFDPKRAARIRQKEETLDILRREIPGFLVSLSRHSVNTENSAEIPVMLHIVNNLEHLGDQSEAILDYLRGKKEGKIHFSTAAMSELKALAAKVSEIVNLAVDSLGNVSGETLKDAWILKDSIRQMDEELNASHMKRLTDGKCPVNAGMIYSDIVNAFNKIAEFSFNIIEIEKELLDAISVGGD